jgi:hypothetical protein
MLTVNQQINAISRFLKGKISKSWIKGNLAKYLAMYEVRECGMVIPFPEPSEVEKAIAKPDEQVEKAIAKPDEQVEKAIAKDNDTEASTELTTVNDVLKLIKKELSAEDKVDSEFVKEVDDLLKNEKEVVAIFNEFQANAIYGVENKEDTKPSVMKTHFNKETLTTYLVDISSIECDVERELFPEEKINELAESILNLGGIAKPLIVKQIGLDEYKLVDNALGYWAAVRAHEIDSYFELIRVFIIKDDDKGELIKQQLSLLGTSYKGGRKRKIIKESEPKNELSSLKIEFHKTTDLLLLGKKTQTRRIWKSLHAKKVLNVYKQGLLVTATDLAFRFGGKEIAYLKIKNLYEQKLWDMTKADVIAEGFPELTPDQFIQKFFGGDSSLTVWVLEFEVVKTLKSVEEVLEKNAKKKQTFREMLAETGKIIEAERQKLFNHKKRVEPVIPLIERVVYDKSFLKLTDDDSDFKYQEALKRFLYLKTKDSKNTWNYEYSDICEELKRLDVRLEKLPHKDWWRRAYNLVYSELKALFDQYYYTQLDLF